MFKELNKSELKTDMERFMKENSGTMIVLSKDGGILGLMKKHGVIPVLVFIRARSTDTELRDKLDNVIQQQWLNAQSNGEQQEYTGGLPTTEIIDLWEREIMI